MIKPLNFEHRIVMVLNMETGRSCALFVEGYEFARAVATGVETGATAMSEAPIEDGNPVLIMVCPEDLIAMRETPAPGELEPMRILTLAKVESLLSKNVDKGGRILAARAPS